MIQTTDLLKEVCQRFATHPFMTVDTEFIREKTYYPELCLIQIASPQEAWCVDALSRDLDLSPLFQLFQNPHVMKVFHAARQDIEIFYMLTHQIPTPLFDTQVAAMVCGYTDMVGYQQLVHDCLGIHLDKGQRYTDWSRRPLSSEQETYALHDVTYLRDVYLNLQNRLDNNGRRDWLIEEMAVLTDPKTYEVDNETAWRKIKAPLKKEKQLYVLSRLAAWREQMAKTKNKPRKHILKDEALLELAVAPVDTPADFDKLRHFPKGFGKSALAVELLHVLKAAQAVPVEQYPQNLTEKKQVLLPYQRSLWEVYRLLLDVSAAEIGVAPRIIASTDELSLLAQGNQHVPCLSGWRYHVFGQRALAFGMGKMALSYDPEKQRLIWSNIP